jgi:hypothetical protein
MSSCEEEKQVIEVKLGSDFMAIFISHNLTKKHSRWVNIFSLKEVSRILIYFVADCNLIHYIDRIRLTDFEIKIKLEEDELAWKQSNLMVNFSCDFKKIRIQQTWVKNMTYLP